MRVSTLKLWITKEYAENSITKGLESIRLVATKYQKHLTDEDENLDDPNDDGIDENNEDIEQLSQRFYQDFFEDEPQTNAYQS